MNHVHLSARQKKLCLITEGQNPCIKWFLYCYNGFLFFVSRKESSVFNMFGLWITIH